MKRALSMMNIGYKAIFAFIIFTVQFYLFRTSVPFFKYPFIILYSGLLVYLLIYQRNILVLNFRQFIKSYIIIIVLCILYCIAFIISKKNYLSVFKGILDLFILLSIFFVLDSLTEGKKELKTLILQFISTSILFALINSVLGLLNQSGIHKISAAVDNNFALLPVFFGMISTLFILAMNKLSVRIIILYNFLLSVFLVNIVLAGSRRGIIAMIIILCILVFSQFFVNSKKNEHLKSVGRISRYFLLTTVLIFVMVSIFSIKTSCYCKNKIMTFLGVENVSGTKKQLAYNFYRYYTIINKRYVSFKEFYNSIKSSKFDSRDPDCGWELNVGKRVYPLVGEGVEMISENAIGAYLDSTSVSNVVFNNKLSKRIVIDKIDSNKDDQFNITIFFYVSDDFDGEDLGIMVLKSYTKDDKTKIHRYDLDCKESWQKLDVNFECKEKGEVPIYFYIFRKDRNYSYKGHIILAYPTFTKLNYNDTVLISNNYYNKKRIFNNLHNISLNEVNDSNVLKKHLSLMRSQKAEIFKLQSLPIIEMIDNDPIRNFIAKFISEDTAYYEYKANLQIDTVFNKFTGPRLNRWRFAWQIFTKEYNWTEKIFGGGFDHLNWFGYYFYHDKTRSDWPHNPFLSVLLYSGLIGLGFYVFVFYKSVALYIKYRKEYYIFLIFFLITFFFSFFSADSPFSPPVMGFLLIFPFFIHSVYKRSGSDQGKMGSGK